jgi:RHS repeat-associated protein
MTYKLTKGSMISIIYDCAELSLTVNGQTTYYASDGTMLAQEYKVNAQTDKLAGTATYMPGPMGPICRVDETNQTEGYYPAGVTSTSPLGRGVTHWYVYDGLGSVIAELDDNNNLTTSGQFDVYGAPRPGTRQAGSSTSSQGYVGSLGHETDASTGGLIYMQARYYDPSLGRFVSEDPSCNGTNWYVYAGDSPNCNVDSNGRSVYSLLWMNCLFAIELAAERYCGFKPTGMSQHLLVFAARALSVYGFVSSVYTAMGVATGTAADTDEAAGYVLAGNGCAMIVAVMAMEQLVLYCVCAGDDLSGNDEKASNE